MIAISKFVKFTGMACLALVTASAMAQQSEADYWSGSIGLRMWNNVWNANNFATSGNVQVATHLTSSPQTMPIATASLRYGDFGISGSLGSNTPYSLNDGLLGNVTQNRTEKDVNFSYYLLPSLSASIGYKSVKYVNSGGSSESKGPTIALSASAPLGKGFGIYGTGGVGAHVLSTDGWLPTTLQSDYKLGEVGLSYSTSISASSLKGITVTAGYRYQKITVRDFPLINNVRDIDDITSGLNLGLIASF